MQVELLDRQRWHTRVELANAIFEYLEVFHNRQRRHSSLGMLAPNRVREYLHGGMRNPATRLHKTRGTPKPPRIPGRFTIQTTPHYDEALPSSLAALVWAHHNHGFFVGLLSRRGQHRRQTGAGITAPRRYGRDGRALRVR
jgi:hypothetical protein